RLPALAEGALVACRARTVHGASAPALAAASTSRAAALSRAGRRPAAALATATASEAAALSCAGRRPALAGAARALASAVGVTRARRGTAGAVVLLLRSLVAILGALAVLGIVLEV